MERTSSGRSLSSSGTKPSQKTSAASAPSALPASESHGSALALPASESYGSARGAALGGAQLAANRRTSPDAGVDGRGAAKKRGRPPKVIDFTAQEQQAATAALSLVAGLERSLEVAKAARVQPTKVLLRRRRQEIRVSVPSWSPTCEFGHLTELFLHPQPSEFSRKPESVSGKSLLPCPVALEFSVCMCHNCNEDMTAQLQQASKATTRLSKMTLADDLKASVEERLGNVMRCLNGVMDLDKAILESACDPDLSSKYCEAVDNGFVFSAEYASQVLLATTQDHLRLQQWPKLREEMQAGGVVTKHDSKTATELRTLVVEHIVAQLIKECTKTSLKEGSSALEVAQCTKSQKSQPATLDVTSCIMSV